MNTAEKNTFGAVIVAAGQGDRFNVGTPKQYINVLDHPLIVWTVYTFACSMCRNTIVVVVPLSDVKSMKEKLFARYQFADAVHIAAGGAERQESVLNGLLSLPETIDYVAIHDGARPAITAELVDAVCKEAVLYGGAVPALPATESTFIESHMMIEQYVDRSHLWQAQTPQVFRRNEIVAAHKKAQEEHFYALDDGIIYRRYIGDVKVVMGDINNIKVTYPQDLIALEAILHTRGEKPR